MKTLEPAIATTERNGVRTVADAMLTIATVHHPATTVGDIRTLFEDDHIHAAVILADGVLLTVIERTDLEPGESDHDLAVDLGTLNQRTVAPETPLEQTRLRMLAAARRRLAVTDPDGTFRGLLCLKRTGTGFCSDQDVHAHAEQSLHPSRPAVAADRPPSRAPSAEQVTRHRT